ncbi:MAG TPA: helix-hairpin-helix domain-containing protein [Chitinophagaceae bacterium]|nr:helix-hairpin-helix domain-containing protein [Chitinophagaceae bacterium]
MAIDNSFIADQLSLLSSLMDIHGENSFAAKSLSIAAFTIEKWPEQMEDIPTSKLTLVKGIGTSVAKKIAELVETGEIEELNDLTSKTPTGVFEMLNIKGVGPKKIHAIWKEMKIETVEELLSVCKENKLSVYKGFGEKTQKNIVEGIETYMNRQSAYLFAQIESYALAMNEKLQLEFKKYLIRQTGDFRRHLLTIDKLEWVTTASLKELQMFFKKNDFEEVEAGEDMAVFKTHIQNIALHFYITGEGKFYQKLFETSGSYEFINAWQNKYPFTKPGYGSEEEIFKKAGTAVIEPYLREKEYIIEVAEKNKLPNVIGVKDIKAIIHCHSVWSDGSNSIEQLAKAAIQRGHQYLVISDHSKTAFYAGGLNEERVLAQQEEVDKLNEKLKPFKIFKSIESDILNDGSLDYSPNILSTFDIVIASPHSSLKMEAEKAMPRLIRAIENPYTTIMGHITGRLLLSRKGLSVDHKKLIDACAANNVVIELNANPRRLDIDWRFIDYCLEKNVLISIDPDAHSIPEFDYVKYGVFAAQKAGVTKKDNVSSFSLKEFEKFITIQKCKIH